MDFGKLREKLVNSGKYRKCITSEVNENFERFPKKKSDAFRQRSSS